MNQKLKNKNIFIAKKNNEEHYLIKAKDYFEDKNNYLQINPNIAIGNFFFKNRNHSYKTIQNNSPLKSPINQKQFNTIESKHSKCKNNSLKLSRPMSAKVSIQSRNNILILNNNKIKSNLNKYYEIKTPTEIIDLFNYYKNNIDNNNKHYKRNIFKIKNDIIQKKIYIQEKTLLNNKDNIIKNQLMSEYLSNMCKKDKNNLLLNKSKKFQLKKQLINYIYKNKSLSEKFGDFCWILNLKRSDKTKKDYKKNFINIGNNSYSRQNELLSELFFDSGDNDLEMVVSPNDTENKIKNGIYKNFKSFEGLQIDGENLLEKEYNDIIKDIKMKKNNIRIKLYKDPSEQKINNIKNIIFKENYLKYKKSKRKENCLKKSCSVSLKKYLRNNKNRKTQEDKYIYL